MLARSEIRQSLIVEGSGRQGLGLFLRGDGVFAGLFLFLGLRGLLAGQLLDPGFFGRDLAQAAAFSRASFSARVVSCLARAVAASAASRWFFSCSRRPDSRMAAM